MISFAWDLLAFNMENICISTIYDGTFVNTNGLHLYQNVCAVDEKCSTLNLTNSCQFILG